MALVGEKFGFGEQYSESSTENLLKEINQKAEVKIRRSNRKNKGKSVKRYEGNSLLSDEFQFCPLEYEGGLVKS